MRIIYSNNSIVKILWDSDKLIPIKQGLQVVEIDEIPENADLLMDIARSMALTQAGDPPRYSVTDGQLIRDGFIVTPVVNADKGQLKAEYVATLDSLQQIEDAISPTNAQVIAAVKFLAKTLRLVIKLFVRQLT